MKKLRLIAVFILLAVVLASCSINSLESYKKAVEKTETIKKGQATSEVKMTMDFNTTGMTEEQVKKLNYFKNVEGTFNVAYDEDAGKMIARNYFNMGGLGFDMDFYKNGDESFAKMPVVGKYIRLNDLMDQAEGRQQTGKGESELISKGTLDSLGMTWLNLLKQENVLKGKQIIQTTPDGEVKATQYTMKLADEQIKALISEWTDTLSKDEKLKETFESNFRKNIKDLESVSYEKLFADIKESLKSYRVEDFQYDAYVDIDGYIVNETIGFSIKFEGTKPGGMTGMNYLLETKNWNINKEQKFEFPVLTEENTLDADKLDQSMPSAFEDFFKKKD